jgi:hypothetical protein
MAAVGGYGNIASNVKVLGQNTTVTIYNISVALANTEVSQALPSDCKGFIIKSRVKAKIQLAYTVGQSGTNYLTIEKTSSYNDTNFYSSQTLYFQTDVVDVIEIIAYS